MRELLNSVMNPILAPVVLGSAPWENFTEFGVSFSDKGNAFTYIDSTNHRDSVILIFDLDGNCILRRDFIDGKIKLTDMREIKKQ